MVVNLLANATSPNVGGVLALVGTPTVSSGAFTQVGSTLTVTPTPGFVGAMMVSCVMGDGKAANVNGTVTITVKAAAEIGAPTVTLKGANPLTLTQGDSYIELGATWTDAKDGSGSDTTITGNLNTAAVGVYTRTYSKTNTAVVGSYTRTYRKTDAAGNTGTATGTATRTVTVNAAPDPMPTGAALANVTTDDNLGVAPIAPINAGGATDPLGRVITYTASGLPGGWVSIAAPG